MFSGILLFLGLALLVFVFVFGPDKLLRLGTFITFAAKGKDGGFAFNEINSLWKAATKAGLKKPEQIFFSVDELDQSINILRNRINFGKKDDPNNEELINLLKKVFNFRKKIEMEKPRYKSGLKGSRDIGLGQILKIKGPSSIYSSKVVENKDDYLVITYPDGPALSSGYKWREHLLNIYFWRKDDAGYFFQSRFTSFMDKKTQLMRLRHTESFLRSQKRKSVRAPAKIAAQLYILKNLRNVDATLERKPGLSISVIDISETGAAIRVRGRGKKGMAVKLQFRISNTLVVALGSVRTLEYYEANDVSVLHLEFLPISDIFKMAILGYVFDVDRSRQNAYKPPRRSAKVKEVDDLSVKKEGLGEEDDGFDPEEASVINSLDEVEEVEGLAPPDKEGVVPLTSAPRAAVPSDAAKKREEDLNHPMSMDDINVSDDDFSEDGVDDLVHSHLSDK